MGCGLCVWSCACDALGSGCAIIGWAWLVGWIDCVGIGNRQDHAWTRDTKAARTETLPPRCREKRIRYGAPTRYWCYTPKAAFPAPEITFFQRIKIKKEKSYSGAEKSGVRRAQGIGIDNTRSAGFAGTIKARGSIGDNTRSARFAGAIKAIDPTGDRITRA